MKIMQAQQLAHEANIDPISEGNNPLREINVDSFMQRLNQELMNKDPTLAAAAGIKIEGQKNADVAMQTPEELAAQEAEREKMLQESMQTEVVGICI